MTNKQGWIMYLNESPEERYEVAPTAIWSEMLLEVFCFEGKPAVPIGKGPQ